MTVSLQPVADFGGIIKQAFLDGTSANVTVNNHDDWHHLTKLTDNGFTHFSGEASFF